MDAEFAEQTRAERLSIMKPNTVFRPGPVERCEGAGTLGPQYKTFLYLAILQFVLDTVFDGHCVDSSHVGADRLEQLSTLFLCSYHSLHILSRCFITLAYHYMKPLLVQSDVESWTNV
jgi:hypothetical protein